MNKHFVLSTLFLLLNFITYVSAQGTAADYQRANSLFDKFCYQIYHSNINPQWIGSSHSFWYIDKSADNLAYKLVQADKPNAPQRDLFDTNKLALNLSVQGKSNVSPRYLVLDNVYVSATTDTLHFEFQNKRWEYQISINKLVNLGPVPPRYNSYKYWGEADNENNYQNVISPNKIYTAFIRNNNLYVRNNKTGQEKALSTNGTADDYYSSNIIWSPDSKKIFNNRFRSVPKRYIYFVQSSPDDQLQPRLHQREYAKPGDALPFRTPVIFHVDSGKMLTGKTNLCSSQFWLGYYIWNTDNSGVTMEYNQRGHKCYRVLEMNAQTGELRTIIDEQSKTFVNYNRHFRYDTTDGKFIVWMSERDNYNHLYLYNRANGKVIRQITKGNWYVRDIQKVDENNGFIYFSANGMNPGEDPYLVHYYRIGMNGKGLVSLTPEEGNHHAVFSTDMQYMVDTYSTVEKAPVTVLRIIGKKSLEKTIAIQKADISRLQNTQWQHAEVFHAPGRDGKTEMWGIIVRPTNFDLTKHYPIIEYIYAGPGSAYTPKDFQIYYPRLSNLAELGFIVVQLDAMGTSFRSKNFEDVCYKNLKDCGFPDRIAWMKAAANKYHYMDTTRVGIFGASAGGQEAMAAVLYHPEFYKAAYSSCGCHDNRMDKMWWNEQWMGYPVDSSYVECSNVVNAHKLTRPLMLVVGEMDDNVDPSSTYQVANALIRANKDFELVVLPGINHTMGEGYGEHKRMDFFVKHLLNVEPPKWE